MIPVIEHYYGHNGGWFNDQKYGCGAGARISIHLYVYDIVSGKPVFSFQDSKKTLYEYRFEMSVIDMEQELQKLEEQIFQDLDNAIPSGKYKHKKLITP